MFWLVSDCFQVRKEWIYPFRIRWVLAGLLWNREFPIHLRMLRKSVFIPILRMREYNLLIYVVIFTLETVMVSCWTGYLIWFHRSVFIGHSGSQTRGNQAELQQRKQEELTTCREGLITDNAVEFEFSKAFYYIRHSASVNRITGYGDK